MRRSAPWRGITPDRMVATIEGLTDDEAYLIAQEAEALARRFMPKSRGTSASHIQAVWGPGWFGVRWQDNAVWFQNQGIRPFTMWSLAGKTIPMWVDDPTGKVARENPKAKTRVTVDGRRQTLIFRRAANIRERKEVVRRGEVVSVPRSYPGAPGRINRREYPLPWTRPGKVGGRIAAGNVGVRWRHPGLRPRRFLELALRLAAYNWGYVGPKVFPTNASWGTAA